MKRLSIAFGIVWILTLMSIPVYPMSFQFDFNGDKVWDTEYTVVTLGETVNVDVYLDWDYVSDPSFAGGTFTYDKTKFAVDDASLSGGCDWDNTGLDLTDDGYTMYMFMFAGCVSCSPDPEGKYLLATFVLRPLGGDGYVRMEGLAQSCDGSDFTPDSADATIYGPCGVEIVPISAEVATGKTFEFKVSHSGSSCEGLPPSTDFTWEITTPENGSTIDETGLDTALYTAGCLVNELKQEDTINVTDNEYGGTATAVVNLLGYYINIIEDSSCFSDPQQNCLYNRKVPSGVTVEMKVAETENCCPIDGNNNFQWSISDTSIGSTITTNPDGTGNYMSGINKTNEDSIDTIKVEDKNNCCGEECASRMIDVKVKPCALNLNPQTPATIGAGGNIPFKVSGDCCPESYDWDLTVDGGIGSTVGATGLYRAGRGFLDCTPVTETVELINDCNLLTTDVEVTPCVVTISPNPAKVQTEGVVIFTAESNECCENDPCYTWEVSSAGTTDSTCTILFQQDVRAGLQTRSTAGTCILEVTDTCNNNSADRATIEVIATTTTTSISPGPGTTTTTTIPIGDSCITHKSCNDLVFCNGEETCDNNGEVTGIYSWSTGLAGSTGNTGNTGNELGICRRGEVPCPDDGLYCTGEISCDEEKKICLSTGDPCEPEGLVCDEASNICRPSEECVADDDCDDDGLFCNGDEICVDGSCGPSGDPCPEGTECVEETDQCATTSVPIEITASPDPLMRSRWIMLPTLVVITGENTSFSQLTSRVSYSPSTALLPLPALVLGPEIIWQLVFVNPSWLAGFPGDPQTVTATVDDAEYVLEIKLLPVILDQ